jgi:hypothetical protein
MTLLEKVTETLEAEASQEQMDIGRYAERRVAAMTNYELLELISQALEAKQGEV